MANHLVPREQKQLHVAAEVAALTVVAPVTAYIALTSPEMKRWQRAFLLAVAAGTLAIDGYLLVQWLNGRR
jgi:hypothetical protein